ncbi:MAG: YicC family protein [Proteobacteria bacterium ST_bin12]|nr:MAG: YicC family protein [Proteobacteria bacterium ST_bin12]
MILSMTGYASQEHNTKQGILLVECRSVNHRYLELQLKLDDNLRLFEATARELIQAKLGRGKVDVRMSMMRETGVDSVPQLNHTVLQQIAESAKTAAQYFPHTQPVNMLDILRMPGVMMSEALDADALEADFKQVLNQVLQHLIDARAREGEKLKAVILDRLQQIEQHVTRVKPMMPNLIAQYQAKLSVKLHEATNSRDDDRIRQEMVLYAQRIDVDEELSRLDSHISEVKRILHAGGAVGKRLDFLMQEMNREANTLGSKSVAVETSQISMELKVLIEQMREQIQNIE